MAFVDPSGLKWYSQVQDSGDTIYRWYTADPGSDWTEVNQFTYNAGEDRGWVALDPNSNHWTDHHLNQEDADQSISFNLAVWNANQSMMGANAAINPLGMAAFDAALRLFGQANPANQSSTPFRAGWWIGFGAETAVGTGAGGAGAGEEGAVTAAENAVTNEGVTIVGETMRRVETAAGRTPGAVILNDMPAFEGETDQVTSQMMRYNRQWILNQMRTGRPILDIGRDPSRVSPSIFYQMERNMVQNYLQLHPNAFTVINR